MFSEKELKSRRLRAAERLSGLDKNVIVYAGDPIGKPGGLDQTYPFIPQPLYYWLTGCRLAGGAAVYSPCDGEWRLFYPEISEIEIIFEGEKKYPEGAPIKDLPDFLRKTGAGSVFIPGKNGTEDPVPDSESLYVRNLLDSVRRYKDADEIALIKKTVSAARAGFELAVSSVRPGITERELRLILEDGFIRGGADGTSFDTIVAFGTHSSVLHFPPGTRKAAKEDIVLIDAGAEIADYCCDITRTFPVTAFSREQREVYDIVLEAQKAAIALCKPGSEWTEVHTAAASVIARGLLDIGVCRGTVQSLLESGAVSMFLPHGIGHFVGLRVRDTGGVLPGRENGKCCGVSLRFDMPLDSGYLVTVEPGLYFIGPMLENSSKREKFGGFINWDKLSPWLAVGGVRIEDNVLVGEEPGIITAPIPKL